MGIELMGLITILVGCVILAAPANWAFTIMVVSTVFGAAAAIGLPALGGPTVLVPSLFLVFFAIRMFIAAGEGPLLASMQPGRAGFWLLLLTAFGLLSAVYFPRLLEGVTDTMTVERVSSTRSTIALTPLRFSSNNITQTVYALGGLVCFATVFAYFRHTGKPEHLIKAILLLAAVDLGFAVIDVVTYFTGTEYLLSFVRTANYALLTASEKGGLKRISGTFPEASAFSEYTLVLFAVVASLWLDRVRTRETGTLSMALLVALLLSTSATALIGLGVVVPYLWTRAVLGTMRGSTGEGRPVLIAACVALIPLAVLTTFVVFPGLVDQLGDFLDEMLLSKAESQSGKERFMWNAMAYEAFLNTSGLGAGLGSARASSYILVLLSNVGLVGTTLFGLFVFSILIGRSQSAPRDEDVTGATIRAARTGLIALLTAACISGTVYDLGLMFYILAGSVAALAGERVSVARPFPVTGSFSGFPGIRDGRQ
ncbi:hypothetical protein ACWKW9_21610 [Rhizobium daejeonense]